MEPQTKDVGIMLMNLRKQKDLTMRDVMDRSHGILDKTTISRVEKNQRNLTLRAAYAFSRIYQVPMDVLAETCIGTTLETSEAPLRLSRSEEELIRNFRQLTRSKKFTLMEMIKGFLLLGYASPHGSNGTSARTELQSMVNG